MFRPITEQVLRGQIFPVPCSSYRLDNLGGSETSYLPARDPRVSRDVPCVSLLFPGAALTVVYSHANAEDLSDSVHVGRFLREHLQCNVVCYEYTGYGSPEVRRGYKPSQASLYADAQAVADHVRNRFASASSCIVSFGRSLGGATAVQVALSLGDMCSGVVLLSPLSSVFGTKLKSKSVLNFLRYADVFDVASVVHEIPEGVPLLVMHGDHDKLVPIANGLRIFESANHLRDKEFNVLAGATHNSTLDPRHHRQPMINALERFLRKRKLLQ
jgi:pimeloyl-ACP methyl ester carboxylesterase